MEDMPQTYATNLALFAFNQPSYSDAHNSAFGSGLSSYKVTREYE